MGLKADIQGFFGRFTIISAIKSADIAGSRISSDVIYEDQQGGDFVRLYETKRTKDPEFPDIYGGTYVERFFDSNLCASPDPVSFRYHSIIQDINAQRSLIYGVGIRPEDESDPLDTFTDFGSGLVVAEFIDSGGADNTQTMLMNRSENVFSAYKDVPSDQSRLTINDPDGDTILHMENDLAEINGHPICLKEHFSSTFGEYTIERTPNGTILQIYQKVYVLNPAQNPDGTITVTLPLALPSFLEEEVNIQVTGLVVVGGIAAGNYVAGTLTATTLNIQIFDGFSFTDGDAYVELTWNA